jgi:glycerol-3-phosphate dehydrogenase (NAD(P)+)
MRIAVLGSGAWGTALAISFAARHEVTLWARDEAQAVAMRDTHRNQRYLPDLQLPHNLAISADLTQALNEVELIIAAVPVSGLRPVMQQIANHFPGKQISFPSATNSGQITLSPIGVGTNERVEAALPGVIWLCKGIETITSLLPHQIVNETLPASFPRGALTGPSFAQEVARGLPTALTLASSDGEFAQRTAKALHHSRLRIYSSTDVVGVEIGGAIKNVLAIAAGICDGMQMGLNARAALLTRGLAEMSRLGLQMGGRAETLGGLSGVGDLILTCTGDLSRNRQVGMLLAQRHSLSTILGELGHVAEGVYTAHEVQRIAQQQGVEMPICQAVYRVLYENMAADKAVEALLSRQPGEEFSSTGQYRAV